MWWDPDAPEPLSGETLALVEKNKALTTKAGTGVKMGSGNSPPRLWWDPDAPEPLSGENLVPLEKNQAYTTKAGISVKMG